MDSFFALLDSNIFQTTIALFGGYIAWLIYKRQRHDALADAAVIVKLEIASLKSMVENLKTEYEKNRNKADLVLFSHPLYQRIDWYSVRGRLARKLNENTINEIDKFYRQIVHVEEARLLLQSICVENRIGRAHAFQDRLTELYALVVADEITVETMLDKNQTLREMADRGGIVYIPASIYGNFSNEIDKCSDMIKTAAFEELEKLTRLKK